MTGTALSIIHTLLRCDIRLKLLSTTDAKTDLKLNCIFLAV